MERKWKEDGRKWAHINKTCEYACAWLTTKDRAKRNKKEQKGTKSEAESAVQKRRDKKMFPLGFEPRTFRVLGERSTDWATRTRRRKRQNVQLTPVRHTAHSANRITTRFSHATNTLDKYSNKYHTSQDYPDEQKDPSTARIQPSSFNLLLPARLPSSYAFLFLVGSHFSKTHGVSNTYLLVRSTQAYQVK